MEVKAEPEAPMDEMAPPEQVKSEVKPEPIVKVR